MPQLENYFREEQNSQYEHPVIRRLAEMEAKSDFGDAKVEVVRPRMSLGYKPAKLYVHFYAKSGAEMDRPWIEDWDEELNSALIQRQIRATSTDNEKVRSALGLRAALQGPEARFGDGYYNGVLIDYIRNSSFKDQPAIEQVLPHIRRIGFDPHSWSYRECSNMIDWEIRGRARELTKDLGYEIPVAEDILATAVAQYLDDRFSVTGRRNLGLL